MKAIIIEDNLDSVFLLKDLIEKHWSNLKVLGSFSDTSSSKEFLKSSSVDLVFLDLELNGENGLDLLNAVDQLFEVIVITGDPSFGAKAFRYNVLDYLLKPITL